MRGRSVVLHVLLLLSGFCGIAYEILYARLLGNLFGSQFLVNASVLSTFLLGIGLGSLAAYRWRTRLWMVEAGIGVYALLMVLATSRIDALVYDLAPTIGVEPLASAIVVTALLLVPAFLIGCSVPLFAGCVDALQKEGAFGTTYELYNIGAAITVLAVEFVVLRSLGLARSITLLAAGNFVVAAGVLFLIWRGRLALRSPRRSHAFAGADLTALAAASVASAVFQALMLKLSEFLFGPFNETVALVLATVLGGLAIGSILVGRLRLTFAGALVIGLVGMAALGLLLPGVMWLFARAYPTAVQSYPLLVLVKLGAVALMMGLPAVGLGATIPALLREYGDVARESGQLLFVSAIANAAGFFLMAFLLHRYLEYGTILVCAVAFLSLAFLVHQLVHRARRLRAMLGGLLAAGAALLVVSTLWNEELLYIGHTNFHSVEALREERDGRIWSERFRGPQDVFAITWKNDEPYFFINGYISIPLRRNAEKLVGALGSMLAPRLDRALVLGLGSGATAGTVALFFEETDVVEINGVILDNLDRLAEYSFSIASRDGVRLVHDDAMHFVKGSGERYSLILNTVTTPLYFSSSKLYTADFFRSVRRRLTPDGVYLTWLDGRVGDTGFAMILETLEQSFDSCWMSFMNDDYFILMCSPGPIRPQHVQAVVGQPELARAVGRELDLPLALAPYHVMSVDALQLPRPEETPVNTLDSPALEFEMASLEPGGFDDTWRKLPEIIDLRAVGRAFEGTMEWQPGEFALYRDLRTGRETELNEILVEAVQSRFGDVAERYVTAALDGAADVGTSRAFASVGRRLVARSHFPAALEAFTRAQVLDPELPGIGFYLGRAQFGIGDLERALAEFERQVDLDGDERSVLGAARALIELGRPSEALKWLAGRPGSDSDLAAEGALLRGRAHLALADRASALLEFRRALSLSPDDQEAQAAMREAMALEAERGGGEAEAEVQVPAGE